jgi:hypothetical protein
VDISFFVGRRQANAFRGRRLPILGAKFVAAQLPLNENSRPKSWIFRSLSVEGRLMPFETTGGRRLPILGAKFVAAQPPLNENSRPKSWIFRSLSVEGRLMPFETDKGRKIPILGAKFVDRKSHRAVCNHA